VRLSTRADRALPVPEQWLGRGYINSLDDLPAEWNGLPVRPAAHSEQPIDLAPVPPHRADQRGAERWARFAGDLDGGEKSAGRGL